ncbi:ABC transporter ATP-binding protein [Lactobacillus sp. CC-MHH1034]|uniref:ATP-binding cassette domain-containing protein n=1 Tax=Agrilactobacillus fermenti TaxID=2586909 RepID=UPI001E50B371|nr:ABC transporter ATP-binding protein [Agrilactobacillus fermenti]MCD2257057.1 ABC transporter ATP-binding protein [Agrilactobacillus fermenti]
MKSINLTFETGHIYGLLGRNGAGKSTLLNLINNRMFVSDGTIALDGHPIKNNEQALNQLFMTSEDTLYPGDMRVKKMWRTTQDFYGTFDWSFAKRLARNFNLDPNFKLKKLSTGNRSIAKLITALGAPTKFIFLDEPTLGMDATNRDIFYQALLEKFGSGDQSLILSTHLIQEVEKMIDHIFVIDHGQLIEDQSVEAVQSHAFAISGSETLIKEHIASSKIMSVEPFGKQYKVYVRNYNLADLPDSLHAESLDLQAYFVKLTNRGTF